MKNLGVVAIAMLGLVSCGGNSDSSSSGFGTPVLATKVSWPVLLDKSCQSTFGSEQDINFTIDYLISGKRVSNNIDFTNQFQENYVMSKPAQRVISKSFRQNTVSRDIFVKYNSSEDSYEAYKVTKEVELSPGSSFEVCPDRSSYSDETIQGIALRTSNILHATNSALKAADPSLELAPVSLSVAPKHQMIVKFVGGIYNKRSQKMFQTENASYHPFTKTITMYPHSEDYIEENSEYTPFWSIPMVASHEYGHHVFQTLYTEQIVSDIFKPVALKSHNCFKSHLNLSQNFDEETTTLKEEVVESDYMWSLGALNEGFADLIAFYSLSDAEFSLKTVQCFEKNREVNSPVFGIGTQKKYTDRNIKIIDGETEPVEGLGCNFPNLTQIHDAGAVFAHQANNVLSGYTSEKQLKLKTLLAWIQTLAVNHADFREMKKSEFLFHAFELLIKQADQEFNVLNPDNCDAVEKVFPNNNGKYECKYL